MVQFVHKQKVAIILFVLLILGILSLRSFFAGSSIEPMKENIPKSNFVPVPKSENGEEHARQHLTSNVLDPHYAKVEKKKDERKANACIFVLVRNRELWDLVDSINELERRFNSKYNYPYVMVNDAPFTDEFKNTIQKYTKSKIEFGQVPVEHWSIPEWIDEEKAKQAREKMNQDRVIYGGSLPYRHMCRYNSGFFFRHPLALKYDYYWRVEPGVHFYCDMDYDPFLYMEDNEIEYGFTLALSEYRETIPTLWEATKEFIEQNKQDINKNANSLGFVTDDKGDYNLCHYWSNFEIASMKFLRSEKYLKYFDFLDKKGGFFYERWGDAPVHSLGVSMFLPKSKIHHFEDVGYFHGPFTNCPANPMLQLKCECDPKESYDASKSDCLHQWYSSW